MLVNERYRGNAEIIDNFVVVAAIGGNGDGGGGGGRALKCDACLLVMCFFLFSQRHKVLYSLTFTNVISTHLPTTDMKKDEMEESTLKRKSNKLPQTFMYCTLFFHSLFKTENKRSRYHMYSACACENKATTANFYLKCKSIYIKQCVCVFLFRLHSRGSAIVSGV